MGSIEGRRGRLPLPASGECKVWFMKAVVLREFGGPDKLAFEEVPDACPGPGDIVVKVAAVSINRGFDIGVRQGRYTAAVAFPLVLGADPSGFVVAASPGVTSPRIGDRVAIMSSIPCRQCRLCRSGDLADCTFGTIIGVHRWGGYAEYVAVPAANASIIPSNLGFEDATVIARHGAAAQSFVNRRGRLRCGETALILGAAGALGGFAVQAAKMAGARVIAAAGSDERTNAALRLGADAAINYRRNDLMACVMDLTHGRGADLAFESSSDAVLWPQAFACLAPRGRLVTAGAHAGTSVTVDTRRLYTQRLEIIGAAGVDVADIDSALSAASEGKFKAHINRVLPLSAAAEGHRIVEDGGEIGKILLDPTRRS